MNNFVFITDLHLKTSSNVRTGDFLEDVAKKLEWTADYCNGKEAALLIGGDVFDTPSVPDMVKNRIVPILRSFKYGVYSIRGNHDRLYDNTDYNFKTSYQTLVSSGIVRDLDEGNVEMDSVILSSTIPVLPQSKPVIFLYHGFLNQEDGKNTFRFSDIKSHSNDLFICLGHDHAEYSNIQLDEHTRIIRPGSFTRTSRKQEYLRNPNLVHISVIDGRLYSRLVPIKCRDYSEVFETKEAYVPEAVKEATYTEVIAQISNASKSQMTFKDALNATSEPDVFEYLMHLLAQAKMDRQSMKQNL